MHQLLLLAGLCSAAPGLTGAVALQVREIEAPAVRSAGLAGDGSNAAVQDGRKQGVDGGPSPALPALRARSGLPLHEGEKVVKRVAVSAPPAKAPADVLATLRIPGGWSGVTMPALVREGTTPLPDGGAQHTTSYIGNLRREGDDLVADTVRPVDREDVYSVVELADSAEMKLAPELVPDPLDTAPRGDRGMLVLVHGLDRDTADTTSHGAGKTTVWDTLRTTGLRERVSQSYKIFIYRYPTYRTTRENGERLAQLIRQVEPDLPERQLALCAHSMGGQVARYAAAAPELAGRVGIVATFAGVHHGTILASMSLASWHIIERIGPVWYAVLKGGSLWQPDTPGLRSLCWDNFDGSVTADERERFALPINDELAAFNGRDPNTVRTVTLQGDIQSLSGKGPFFGLAEEIIRRGAATYNPEFANIDPLVPLESGLFQGPSHQAISYPGFDHSEIVGRTETWNDVVPLLESAHRGRRIQGAD